MSSRCPTDARRLLLVGLVALAAGCDRERRAYRGATAPETGPPGTTVLAPERVAARDPRGAEYEGIAFHVAQGQRWYAWFNCTGCHAQGGGDIGPPLLDAGWRYGSSIDAVYTTIAEGRPNGMPAFRHRMTDRQIWQVAAYVRALSGQLRHDVVPSRRDALAAIPPLTRMPEQPERVEPVPPVETGRDP